MKALTSTNTEINTNINLNVYNTIISNKKRIFSSLRIKTKSNTPKINNFVLAKNKKKPIISKSKKRYNSVKHSSPENYNLKVKKKLSGSIQKSVSMEKNNKITNVKNKSFNICNNSKKKLSPKEHIIEEKIKELESQVLKFREERNKVNEVKNKYEKLQDKLFNDIDDFVKKKEEFEKFKQNEINNINKERKNMLLENKDILNVKNQNKSLELEIKKNEEIIVKLKMQIKELQILVKNKDYEIKNLQKIIYENNLNLNKNKNENYFSNKERIKKFEIHKKKLFKSLDEFNNNYSNNILFNTERNFKLPKIHSKTNLYENNNNEYFSNNNLRKNSILSLKHIHSLNNVNKIFLKNNNTYENKKI
jgi:structural maintenance of chromosome 2